MAIRVKALLRTALITMASCASLTLTPVYAGTGSIDKLCADFHKGASSYACSNYDLDGDGVKDTISIVPKDGDSKYGYQHISILVNGIEGLSITTSDSEGIWQVIINICNFADGSKYIHINDETFNSFSNVNAIYRFSNNHLYKAFDLKHMLKPKKVKVYRSGRLEKTDTNIGLSVGVPEAINGNTLKINGNLFFPATMYTAIEFTLAKKADGSLYRPSKLCTMTNGRPGYYYTSQFISVKGKYKAMKTVKVYKNATSSKVKFKMKKGTRLRVSKIYLANGKARILIKTSSGKTGWVNLYQNVKSSAANNYSSTLFNGADGSSRLGGVS